MPELPEVETVTRGLKPHIEGRVIQAVIVREHRLREPIAACFPAQLRDQKIHTINRRGKYLLLQCQSGTLIVHLGMSGRLYLVKPSKLIEKHAHCDFKLNTGWILRYTDPRRFGLLIWDQVPLTHPRLVSLGPEPLDDSFDGKYLFQASRKRQRTIKSLIMDSHILVGVGNIYANEALYIAGIHPERPANSLTKKQCQKLATAIQQVLNSAILAGGTTLKDFVNGNGQPGYFKQSLSVYGRAQMPCLECGRRLQEIRLQNRQTVFCTHCQS